MNSDYTLQFNIKTLGKEDITKLAADLKQLADQTKKNEDAVKTYMSMYEVAAKNAGISVKSLMDAERDRAKVIENNRREAEKAADQDARDSARKIAAREKENAVLEKQIQLNQKLKNEFYNAFGIGGSSTTAPAAGSVESYALSALYASPSTSAAQRAAASLLAERQRLQTGFYNMMGLGGYSSSYPSAGSPEAYALSALYPQMARGRGARIAPGIPTTSMPASEAAMLARGYDFGSYSQPAWFGMSAAERSALSALYSSPASGEGAGSDLSSFARLQAALGRVGGRIGGAAIGEATGIPGGGFIGSQLAYSLGISGGAALGMLGAGVGIFAGVELTKHLEQLSKWAQEQKNVSTEIGITVEQMQRLSNISNITGVNLTTTVRSISKLGEEVIGGGSRAAGIRGSLEALGLNESVAFGNPAESLNKIMDAAAHIADQGTRIRILTELLGENGRAVAALADRWNQLSDSQKNKVFSDTQMKNLEEAREKIVQLGQQWDLMIGRLAVPATSVINFLYNISGGGGTPDTSPHNTAEREKNQDIYGLRALMRQQGIGSVEETKGADYKRKLKLFQDITGPANTSDDQAYKTSISDIESHEKMFELTLGGLPDSQVLAKAREFRAKRDYAEELKAGKEPVAELGKRSMEVYASGYFGKDNIAARRASELQKIEDERKDMLRKYGAAYSSQINSFYNTQKAGVFMKYIDEYAAQRSKQEEFFQNTPYSDVSGVRDLMKGIIAPGGSVSAGGLITQDVNKSEPLSLFDFGSKGTGLFSQIGLFGEFQPASPLPTGYMTLPQQMVAQKNISSRLQSLLPLQARAAGMSGQSEADAALQLRLQTAQKEYQIAVEMAKLKGIQFEEDKAREEALDKLKQDRFDAETEHEKNLIELYNEAKSQFAGGIESIILGAQNGGGKGARGALRSVLEGQEGTIIRNIAGMIFNNIHLPHAGKGTKLGDILSGTIFGPRDDKIPLISENTQRAADYLEQILALLNPTGVSGGGSMPPGSWKLPNGVTINPGGSIGGTSSSSSPLGTIAQLYQIMGGGNSPQSSSLDTYSNQAFGGGIGLSSVLGVSANNPISVIARGGDTVDSSGNVSNNGNFNLKGMIGAGLQLAAAGATVYAGIQSISHGGGKSTAGGIGELLGVAGMLTGNPALMAAGAVAGLVSMLMPDPRAERAANENRRMFTQQYLAPPAMNLSVGGNGGYTDVSATGDIRSTNFSPYPVVRDPYEDNPHRVVIPGGIVSTYGGYQNITGAQGKANAPMVNVSVSAMDSQSFIDNAGKITDAVNHHIVNQDSPLMRTLNQRFQGRNN